ncbi:MAG TPA: PEGA domain-containing protein, partial [Chromatiales bacterium]|nr:PEGA domain-containing protein [Chromatiales bacterium]
MVRKREYVRRRLLFVCAALLLSGCSVLPVPDLRTVTIRSDPPGAEVLANGETIGTTPLTIVPDKVFRPRVDWQNLEYRAMGVLALRKAGCKLYSERVNDAVLSKDITVKLDCSAPVAAAPAGSTAASAVTMPPAQPPP